MGGAAAVVWLASTIIIIPVVYASHNYLQLRNIDPHGCKDFSSPAGIQVE